MNGTLNAKINPLALEWFFDPFRFDGLCKWGFALCRTQMLSSRVRGEASDSEEETGATTARGRALRPYAEGKDTVEVNEATIAEAL